MVKLCTWLPMTELEEINKVKGDISTSLFIRRAIRKAINDNDMMTTTTLSNNLGDKTFSFFSFFLLSKP
jgi:hypothetical protein